jgi:poly(3-hydroxybutyrate) depolymerase
MFYTVSGGGHTIPSIRHILNPAVKWIVGPQNRDIEGAGEAWNFLSRHSLGNAK